MYPYLISNYSVHYSDNGGFLINNDNNSRINLNFIEIYILEKIDGRKTLDTIVNNIAKELHSNNEDEIRNVVLKFINYHKRYISFMDKPSNAVISFTGKKGYKIPVDLSIELTNRCNLRCIHCLKDAGYSKNTSINYKNLINVLKFLKNKVVNLQLTGGEPMLHPYFFEVLQYCKANFNNIMVSTTATLINRNNAYKFKGVFVPVLLYSTDEQEHEKITLVRGSYKNTLNGIQCLVNENVDVCISSLINQFNYNKMDDMVKFLIYHRVRNIKFGILIRLGRAQTLERSWELDQLKRKELNLITKELNVKYKDKIKVSIFSDDVCKKDNNGDRLSCGAGIYTWTINENGNILPCPYFPEDKFSMGNINCKSMEHIVNHINLNNMCSDLREWDKQLKKLDNNVGNICSSIKEIYL